MGDKVIMIGKYSPGFKFPAEVAGDSEKTALQNVETLPSAKMVSFEIGARCDEVGAIFQKLMLWRVRPGRCRLGHAIRVTRWVPENNEFDLRMLFKSGGTPPHSQNTSCESDPTLG